MSAYEDHEILASPRRRGDLSRRRRRIVSACPLAGHEEVDGSTLRQKIEIFDPEYTFAGSRKQPWKRKEEKKNEEKVRFLFLENILRGRDSVSRVGVVLLRPLGEPLSPRRENISLFEIFFPTRRRETRAN